MATMAETYDWPPPPECREAASAVFDVIARELQATGVTVRRAHSVGPKTTQRLSRVNKRVVPRAWPRRHSYACARRRNAKGHWHPTGC